MPTAGRVVQIRGTAQPTPAVARTLSRIGMGAQPFHKQVDAYLEHATAVDALAGLLQRLLLKHQRPHDNGVDLRAVAVDMLAEFMEHQKP